MYWALTVCVHATADNATRGSWPIIEQKCPWLCVGGCLPHCMDLLLEDIFKAVPVFQALYKAAKQIRKFIHNHQVRSLPQTLGGRVVCVSKSESRAGFGAGRSSGVLRDADATRA